MQGFLKTYGFSLLLLLAVLAGGIAGALIGPAAKSVEPIGDLFLRLLFMIIPPLVFFGVASASASLTDPRRLGQILGHGLAAFLVLSLLSALIAWIGCLVFDPLAGVDTAGFRAALAADTARAEVPSTSWLAKIVETISVADFHLLLSRKAILPLLVIALLTGLATSRGGEAAAPFARFLAAGAAVTNRMVELVMGLAPLGLGCYFAAVTGALGGQILAGYARVFVLYLGLTVIYLLIVLPLGAWLSGGRSAVHRLLRHAPEPSLTALATCSSAASIPVNLQAAQRMDLPADVSETLIPLGANLHKDGSVMGGVLKVVFLLSLTGGDWHSLALLPGILIVSVLVGAVMGAIPGGGMIGEMLILSVYGWPAAALPVIAVISTIIDAPATLLNVIGDLPPVQWAAARVKHNA